ncbi:universal stress protein [Oricola sp.]|uniref:universal stress protein n=1 Tax=Oricola sp. TaxID=1979950 RepID=UPI003BA9CE83
MFKKIMLPVDLAHVDKLALALDAGANLAKLYKIPVVYVGVTTEAPSALGHNPAEFTEKLRDFADDQGVRHGIATDAKAYASHDPATDLDETLIGAVKETGCDLVVMATHVPTVVDNVWPSNGGRVATHTDASVFLVRG